MVKQSWMVSVIPMVGCRNRYFAGAGSSKDGISHSDGGVSELITVPHTQPTGWYQSFRWWGVGTQDGVWVQPNQMVSVIPMVGCRNDQDVTDKWSLDGISHSDGGVSEQRFASWSCKVGWYQSFRWWGVGTNDIVLSPFAGMVSVIPMVGCRNTLGHCKYNG